MRLLLNRLRSVEVFDPIGRFFEFLAARRLRPHDQDEVSRLLDNPSERSMFWAQSMPDQRHALVAARLVGGMRPDRRDLVRAALLHDIGKRQTSPGPLGRAVAVIGRNFGLSVSNQIRSYLDHGRAASIDLERAGAEALVVAFAQHHHGDRPPIISPEDWEILIVADRSRLLRALSQRRITKRDQA